MTMAGRLLSERTYDDGRRSRPRVVAAVLVGIAGAAHALLIPQHVAEGAVFGAAFVVMAALQVALAAGLLLRPGPWLDDLGRRSTALLIALYLLARVVPVPGKADLEEASVIGGVTVAIEVAALVALARLPRARPPRLGPRAAGVLAACVTAVAVPLFTGSLRWIPSGLSAEASIPSLVWRDHGWSSRSPTLAAYFTEHLVLYGSVLTLLLTSALATEVGFALAATRRRPERRRLLFWAPAFVAAPVCCGAPLFGIVGPAAFALLVEYGWVPLAVAVAVGALALASAHSPGAPLTAG